MTGTRTLKPFAEWPGGAQLAFEHWYALDARNRTHGNAAQIAGASVRQIRRWADTYGWPLEAERRDRALADEARERMLTQRRRVLEAAENGIGSLITRYSAAAQGRCPVCMGKGTLKVRNLEGGTTARDSEEICPRCAGRAVFDPMNLNMLAFDRAVNRYGVMVGDLSSSEEGPRGPLSHEEWLEHQRGMLELSGAKVARMMHTLADANGDEDA